MPTKKYKYDILRRSLALIITIVAILWLYRTEHQGIMYLAFACLIVEIYLWHQQQIDLINEFQQYVESIKYHDFTQSYTTKGSRVRFVEFKEGYNTINQEFHRVAKEKEKQYQYLQKIMSLVDTGILLFDTNSGEVLWINEALKKILSTPFLKNIQSLARFQPQLLDAIKNIDSNENIPLSIRNKQETIKLQLSCSLFNVEENTMKLIVLQNVNEVVDITESDAWHKLLRVLTHEIMNSIAPISSLANTLYNRLDTNIEELKPELKLGIKTIKTRSEGLLRFAQVYRSFNKLETIHPTKFRILELFESLDILFEPTLAKRHISFEIILKKTDLEIVADKNLLEQVFINLIRNAIDALESQPNPVIQVCAETIAPNRIELKVIDNGSGMEKEIEERIFIPFFSTKNKGNGIGLSLCKQILLLHNGKIQIHTILGQGTAFSLELPQLTSTTNI